MNEIEQILQRDYVYWDISKAEVVLEKDGTKPEWAYLEMRKDSLDNTITEYYKDGNLRLTFQYEMDSPRQMVQGNRNSLFNNNKGNWTKYMVTMPEEEFKKTIELYYFGD